MNEYGCSCFYSKLRNLSFFMRLSLRSNCIVTLSVVSRDSVDNCQRNFLAYYINVWLTLLVKLKEN